MSNTVVWSSTNVVRQVAKRPVGVELPSRDLALRYIALTLEKLDDTDLYQFDYEALGMPRHIAMDAAYRMDLLSDHVLKEAGLERDANWNPAEIGVEVAGPKEQDADEPWMKGEFTQQENRELREEQEAGALGPKTVEGPQAPQSGKQSFDVMGRQAAARQVVAAQRAVHEAALNVAGGKYRSMVAGLTNLAASLMRLQAGIISGTTSADKVASVLNIVGKVMPHVAAVEEKDEEEAAKVARMIDLVLRSAKKAEDEEVVEEVEDEEEKTEKKAAKKSEKKSEEDDEEVVEETEKKKGKKGGDVPEAFKKQWDKNKDDDKGDDKKKGKKSDDDADADDKKPDFLKEKAKKGKKAHGYDLFAK